MEKTKTYDPAEDHEKSDCPAVERQSKQRGQNPRQHKKQHVGEYKKRLMPGVKVTSEQHNIVEYREDYAEYYRKEKIDGLRRERQPHII